MTTSGSVTYSLNAGALVEASFGVLGLLQEGVAITTKMTTDGMRALNLMLKTFGTMAHLWLETERSLALISGVPFYLLDPKPMRVTSIRRRQTTGASIIDIPLNEWSRQEYFDQPNKTGSPSIPVSYYYDPQSTAGTLYVWPAPSASTALNVTLEITYLRRIQDMVASTDDLDMPQEWLEAVVWNLARRLMTQYPVNDSTLALRVDQMAVELMGQLKGFDHEPASIFLQPDRMPWR